MVLFLGPHLAVGAIARDVADQHSLLFGEFPLYRRETHEFADEFVNELHPGPFEVAAR
jgi:hypothetical protein